jgi:pyruvate/2-oxoacid:ferredoxin oxidoreductase beta subunit
MEKQIITIGNYAKGFIKLEYDELYYTKSIQDAIVNFMDGIYFVKDLKECVQFIDSNTDYFKFLFIVVQKNIVRFQNKETAYKLIYEYSKELFENIDEETFKQLDKNKMAEHTFTKLIVHDILKVKPLMNDIGKKIYESIKQ